MNIQLQPQFKEVDIVKKYFKYPEFKKQLDTIDIAYRDRLNMALYCKLNDYQALEIFKIHPSQPNHSFLYVHFYGYRMPPTQNDADKVYLLWIRMLDEQIRLRPNRKYIIIYYHAEADSSYPWTFIKNIYKKLPLLYYALLEKIIVVEPNLMLKSVGFLDFTRLNKLFMRRLQFIQNIQELSQIQAIKKDNVMSSMDDFIKKAGSKQQLQKQIVPISMPPKMQKRDFLTIELVNHELNADGIPIVLQTLLETMKLHPQMVKLQGIFRKAGCIDEEEQIINSLQKNKNMGTLDGLQISGHSLAAVIKKFFTKLLTPIFPYEAYNKIAKVITIRPEQQVIFLQNLLNQIPKINRVALLYLVNFLKEQVIPHQQFNKMNNHNMSVVFYPCFFRSETLSFDDLLNSGKFAGVLKILFEKFEIIIGNQENSNKRNSRGRKSKQLKEKRQN